MFAIAKLATAQPATGRRIVMTRTFAAPRDLVFRLWTHARHRACWWGPGDFAGFRDVIAPERLAFVARSKDGVETHNTVTFAERGGHTTLTVTAIGTIA